VKVLRRLPEHVARHGHRLLPPPGAEVEGRLVGADLGIGGVEFEGALGMGRGGVEVVDRERELGEALVPLGIRPVLLDEAQILADRLVDPAQGDEFGGIGVAGGRMVAIKAEDVAELDHRPLGLALGEQGHAALIMGLGALLGSVAGGKDRRHRHKEDGPNRSANALHRPTPVHGRCAPRTARLRPPSGFRRGPTATLRIGRAVRDSTSTPCEGNPRGGEVVSRAWNVHVSCMGCAWRGGLP
jgi:hypothetical protein